MTNKNELFVTIQEQDTFISRIINAPRDLVFKAWTDPEHLKHWFAPRGCSIHFTQIDVQPGGGFHSCIRTPDLKDCWCKGTYLEIVAPERIVFSMAVSDEHGNLITPEEAGMAPDWPQETIVTVTFTAEGEKTKFTLHQTVSEILAKRTGAYPSWLDMLDILEAQLQQQPGGSR